jgi:hypothetical protein
MGNVYRYDSTYEMRVQEMLSLNAFLKERRAMSAYTA